MTYEKVYDGKVFITPVNLSEVLKSMPANVRMEDVKIIPVYNILTNGGSELIGFKFVAYRTKEDDF